jgi:hypothetical protein
MSKSTPTIPWQHSRAKEILTLLILEETVKEDSNAAELYNSHDEFQQYKFPNFKRNLKNLIESLKLKEDRALSDAAALAQDTARFLRPALTSRGYPFWDTSDAKVFLIKDIDEGEHLRLDPIQLWNSREAYQQFPKHIFRGHVHQETYKRRDSSYWRNIMSEKKNRTSKKQNR